MSELCLLHKIHYNNKCLFHSSLPDLAVFAHKQSELSDVGSSHSGSHLNYLLKALVYD